MKVIPVVKADQPKRGAMEVQALHYQYRKIGLKRHLTVRIPSGISDSVDGFLKTEQARKMGFDSKADVATAAVRRMLTEYGYYRLSKKIDAEEIKR